MESNDFLTERATKQKKLVARVRTYADYPFSKEEVCKEVDFLKDIYTNKFRHDYADFFKLVEQISNNLELCNLEFLQSNLEEIKKAIYESANKSDTIRRAIIKLCDHINLEILRYKANYAVNQQVKDTLEEARAELEKSNSALEKSTKQVQEYNNQLDEAKKKISHVQGESIAIISIFVALTLAFTGGLTYISSAFSVLKDTSFLKIIAIVLLCGLIVFNTTYALLYVVFKFLGKDTNACRHCKTEETCNNGFKRFLKTRPLFIFVNIVLIALLLISIIILIIPYVKNGIVV